MKLRYKMNFVRRYCKRIPFLVFFYVHILFQLADFSSTKAFDFFFSSHFQNLQVKRLGPDFWVKCLFVSSVGENYSKKKKVLHYRLLF